MASLTIERAAACLHNAWLRRPPCTDAILKFFTVAVLATAAASLMPMTLKERKIVVGAVISTYLFLQFFLQYRLSPLPSRVEREIETLPPRFEVSRESLVDRGKWEKVSSPRRAHRIDQEKRAQQWREFGRIKPNYNMCKIRVTSEGKIEYQDQESGGYGSCDCEITVHKDYVPQVRLRFIPEEGREPSALVEIDPAMGKYEWSGFSKDRSKWVIFERSER